ncbi:hypothetical protein C9374_012450 [Naegleria lovaniensis]|uniref:histidine kinase n=1 Tax=Naegleria lovaniensis TaxID=51637 RepID=A0AA88KNK5_NAELO|nr:uncharacterized protein C9374_012450 [Naegleria lovaniensis]KAG2392198.1 hypothetical protein C9374_012450 [Naegleria lovaniensis]
MAPHHHHKPESLQSLSEFISESVERERESFRPTILNAPSSTSSMDHQEPQQAQQPSNDDPQPVSTAAFNFPSVTATHLPPFVPPEDSNQQLPEDPPQPSQHEFNRLQRAQIRRLSIGKPSTLGRSSFIFSSDSPRTYSSIHEMVSRWERHFLELTRLAYISVLTGKKRLSEWTLMNQIAERIAEITSSKLCVILKEEPPSSPIHSSLNTEQDQQEQRLFGELKVIGLFGLDDEDYKRFVHVHHLSFPTQKSHAMFIKSFMTSTPIISTQGSFAYNLPPGHIEIFNSICIPICFGKYPLGVLIAGNRDGDYIDQMINPLSALCNSIGHIMKMYSVEVEDEKITLSAPATNMTTHSSSATNNEFPLISINDNISISQYSSDAKDTLKITPRHPPTSKQSSHKKETNPSSLRRASSSSGITSPQSPPPISQRVYMLGKSKSAVLISSNSSTTTTSNCDNCDRNEAKVTGNELTLPPDPNKLLALENPTLRTSSPSSGTSSVLSGGSIDTSPLFDEMENELLNSAEVSLAVFKAVRDGILILDSDLHVTTMNPSAKKFFGILQNSSPLKFNGDLHITELIPDNYTQRLVWSEICNSSSQNWVRRKALAKCRNNNLIMRSSDFQESTPVVDIVSNNPISPIDTHFTTPTSSFKYEPQDFCRMIPVLVSASSFFFGNETFYAVTVTDETTKEDMKEKMKFIAFLSHELRNPIQVIVSGVQCLVDMLNKDVFISDERNYIVKSLFGASEFISLIINDMIDLTKLESGHMKIFETTFDIRDKVMQVMQMLQIYQEKNLEIKSSIDDNVPLMLYTDSTKLQQILVNILTNSCKYTKKGSVELKVSYTEENNSPRVIFQIKDTGLGIDKSEIPSMFRLYKRLHRKQFEATGSGIGLALSKLLCDILGCSISVDSEKNKGSTFTVEVPFKKQLIQPLEDLSTSGGQECANDGKNNEHDGTSLPDSSTTIGEKISKALIHTPETVLKGKRCLIVDDSDIIRKLLRNMLKEFCGNCKEAENGQEAVQMCDMYEFDFIIMDVIMPIMSGNEAIKKLRSEKKLTTPIVALTGNSLTEEVNALLNIGANKVLLKPVKRAELLSELVQVLSQ